MKVFLVEYTLDYGTTKQTMPVNAKDKSTAIIESYYELPKGAIVLDAFEVK